MQVIGALQVFLAAALFPWQVRMALAQTVPMPTKADSGWVSLYSGTDFNNFYVYVGNVGYTEVKNQTTFTADSGMIKADGPYSLLTTTKEYSHYQMRVDYKFAANAGSSANAGVMILFDNQAAKTVKALLRPRSIEINFRRDGNFPGTLWAANTYGPYITTTVLAGTQKFLPKNQGGVAWTCEPWDAALRVVESNLILKENPPGQWNHLDAIVRGDSVAVYLNALVRTSGWHFQGRGTPDDSSLSKRVPITSGGVSVQAEGFVVWYKNWEIKELDPVSGIPIYARRGCMDPTKPNFDPRATVDAGSCPSDAVRGWRAGKSQRGQDLWASWRWRYSIIGRVLN